MVHMLMVSLSLLTALIVQVLCQLFKLVLYSARDRKFSLKYLSTAGGIPSAHSAFVTSLSVAVGMRSGFGSDVFAVSAVFAAIVIYDAYRLRGAVQNHAKLLNKLTRKYFPEEGGPLNEMIGHTIAEITVGIVLGIVFSFGVTTFLINTIG